MKNKIRYVYIITNELNHKQYVGSRVCYTTPTDDIRYMGSSKYLDIDINLYGLTNFTKKIIKEGYGIVSLEIRQIRE